ncbi:type II secretion system protein GspK [Methylorubrum sp. SB2]|uniref:general secretion pathway protein GspK n=1 Tax=Methylorubrum subtropicum TaxID=3138812 RepID=UPI00313EBE59
MSRDRSGEAGFVLPSVVAILMIVAAAAALATQQMQTHTRTTTARFDGLRLQGLVDGFTRFVAVSLINERVRRLPGLGLPENGGTLSCPLPGGGLIRVTVQDQGGLIDLNASPRPLLEEAFRALGVPDRDAATLAAEIVDDRDADDVPEPMGGAEGPQYKARGLAYGPRNAPYDSIDELDRLPSMTRAIAALLRPAVTVWNTGGGIDPSLNPVLAARGGARSEGLRQHVKASLRQFYEIRVVAETPTGAHSGRAAALSVDGRSTGLGLLTWRSSTLVTAPGTPHPACEQLMLLARG